MVKATKTTASRRSTGLRLRYQRLSGATRQLLSTEGESGRFEFKQDADAVTTSVLVAAANAAVLEKLDRVTILVGVREKADAATGVVTGEVIGLRDVDREKGKITSRGRNTQPVPVGLTTFEENLGTSKPILRVEVRPTRAPHYTTEGHRTTRYGASTRAITDEELVELYLRREAEAFEARFKATASTITQELESVGDSVTLLHRALDQVDARLHALHEIADQAASAAEEGRDQAADMDFALGVVQSSVEELGQAPHTFEEAWHELYSARTMGWLAFERLLEGSDVPEAEAILQEVLSERPSPLDYERNIREARAWYEFTSMSLEELGKLSKRKKKAQLLAAAERVRAAEREPPAEDLRLELEAFRRQRIDPL